jgi:hypothetical protein
LSGVPYDGGRPLTIGAREDHQYLNAVIDDVRVYHRLISLEEVEDLAGDATPRGIRIMRWVEVR